MNVYCNSGPTKALDQIVARLGHFAGAAFLYGSSVGGFQPGHDVDLLFVLAKEHHELVYREISMIQRDCPLPLHPTVVAPLEFATNPRIRELAELGTKLW
jgi:hypothetical protein